MKRFHSIAVTAFLLLFGAGIATPLLACNNSYLSLDSVTADGGNKFTIYFQFCAGGGYEPDPPISDPLEGADNSTMDFWFEVISDTLPSGKPSIVLCPNSYPASLNSGQVDSGCTNCQAATASYNGILFNDPGCCPDPGGRCLTGCLVPGFCPSCTAPTDPPFPNCNFPPGTNPYCPSCTCPPKACPSGDSTCVWYSTNHSPNYTGAGFPLCPETCPGGPSSGRFHQYTDIWAGSGRADSYCVDMYLSVKGGLPDTIIAKGLENDSGEGGYCNDVDLKIPIDSLLASLPVVWDYIEGYATKKNTIDVEWGTSVEVNNNHFEIQKSLDGKTYRNVGLQDAHSGSDGYDAYKFSDMNPVPGYQFYRIKQVDTDGKFGFSDVVSVFFDGQLETHLNYISPIPTHDVVNISFYSASQEDYSLQLLDIQGRVVFSRELSAQMGENVIELDLRNQNSGIYIAKVFNLQAVITGKIIKE